MGSSQAAAEDIAVRKCNGKRRLTVAASRVEHDTDAPSRESLEREEQMARI
jgi:hypothetical protein